MPVVWERQVASTVQEAPYAGLAHVQCTPCYDLLVSLGALYHTQMFDVARPWARIARAALEPDVYALGRYYFRGNQGLGYGAARLVANLPDGAAPEDLVRAVREADPRALALHMVDTGEVSEETLEQLRRFVFGENGRPQLDKALHGLTPNWAQRCRRVLTDPTGIQAEFADLLERYNTQVFAREAEHLAEPLARAARTARALIEALPAVEAIERLTGGYTLGDDLPMRRIVVAPSVFIYPFVFARVDMSAGETLIVYGVQTRVERHREPVPTDPHLLRVMKALTGPNRQKLVRLLARQPMFGPELVAALGLSQPTLHHHLAQLRSAGLVRQERGKGGMRYTFRGETAAEAVDALQRLFAGD